MTKYRILGTTDESDTCDCCGRSGLKRTVMLIALDADGNDDQILYFGTSCAARANRTTSARMTRWAAEAETERAQRIARLTSYLTYPHPFMPGLYQPRLMFVTRKIREVDGVRFDKWREFEAAQVEAWRVELKSLGVNA